MKYNNLITLKELMNLVCIENYIVFDENGNELSLNEMLENDYIVDNINSIPSIKEDKSIQKYRLSLNAQSLLMYSNVIISVRKVTNEVLEKNE